MARSNFIGKKRIYILTCIKHNHIYGYDSWKWSKPFYGTLDAIEYAKENVEGEDNKQFIPQFLKDWKKKEGIPEWSAVTFDYTLIIKQQLVIGS